MVEREITDNHRTESKARKTPKTLIHLAHQLQDLSNGQSLDTIHKASFNDEPFVPQIDLTHAWLIEQLIGEYQLNSIRDHSRLLKGEKITDSDNDSGENPDSWLAKRSTQVEQRILYLLTVDMSDKDIAKSLEISSNTVKHHIANIGKRFSCTDRVGIVKHGIKEGQIDPLLLHVEADFSNYHSLPPRQRMLYDLITDSEYTTNKNLSGELSLSEQVIKNRVSLLFNKVGVTSKMGLILYEAKRREKILMSDRDDFGLTKNEEQVLYALCVEQSNKKSRLSKIGVPDYPKGALDTLYSKLGVSNYSECVAMALYNGYGSINEFASLEAQEMVAGLTNEEKTFLMQYGSFNDRVDIDDRIHYLGVNPSLLMKRFAAFRDGSEATTVHQALVIAKYKRFRKESKDLKKRQQHIDALTALMEIPEDSQRVSPVTEYVVYSRPPHNLTKYR